MNMSNFLPKLYLFINPSETCEKCARTRTLFYFYYFDSVMPILVLFTNMLFKQYLFSFRLECQ